MSETCPGCGAKGVRVNDVGSYCNACGMMVVETLWECPSRLVYISQTVPLEKPKKDPNKRQPVFCLYCGDQMPRRRLKQGLRLCAECEE